MNAPTTLAPQNPTDLLNPENLRVVPLLRLDPHQVQEYFQRQAVYGTLKYRFSDINEPQWLDVLDVIQRMGQSMYLILGPEGQIVGEYMLENPTGKAMQIHFSSDPEISSPLRLQAGQFASRYALSIKNPKTQEYFINTLYGLTPLKNRAACLYVLRVGYKKQGILPGGMMYMGEPVDCMISTFTRES